jgi:hypothetical protein
LCGDELVPNLLLALLEMLLKAGEVKWVELAQHAEKEILEVESRREISLGCGNPGLLGLLRPHPRFLQTTSGRG